MIESFKETAQVFKTKQNKTKQNKTKQNKTKQNKTKQNKTKRGKETFIIYYKKRDTMLQERSILRGRYQI
jgi:hypothetical protein